MDRASNPAATTSEGDGLRANLLDEEPASGSGSGSGSGSTAGSGPGVAGALAAVARPLELLKRDGRRGALQPALALALLIAVLLLLRSWLFVHGECDDGACRCDAGWTGAGCELECVTPTAVPALYYAYTLAADRDCWATQLLAWLGEGAEEGGGAQPPAVELLYRATRDGWDMNKSPTWGGGRDDFHRTVDGMGPTLTVIKDDEGNVFGGFTEVSWASDGASHPSPGAFLFSLRAGGSVKVGLVRPDDPQAVLHNEMYGPVFGSDPGLEPGRIDLFIASGANSRTEPSYADVGHHFALPPGADGPTFLTGDSRDEACGGDHYGPGAHSRARACREGHFRAVEIEVFQVLP